MERWILHCDCNSFYASVEYALNPSLGTGPLAVAGDPKARHGIILAKNEAAKKYGIQTAETVWQALRKCSELKLVPPHHQEYEKFSLQINRIYREYTDLVEPFGLDESFLDVSGTLHLFGCDAKTLADRIRDRIREEMHLTISVGVSFNKTFAKLGSDLKKPDATTFLPKEEIPRRIWPLPVGDLLYVGKASAEKLARLNIKTIGDLAAADPLLLHSHLGKAGLTLSKAARGEENDPVIPPEESGPAKSIGNGLTYPMDLEGKEEIHKEMLRLCESVCYRMHKEKLICRTVSIGWRTPDLKNKSRQGALDPPGRGVVAITDRLMELMESGGGFKGPVRALTVTAQSLASEEETYGQLSFFQVEDPTEKKREKLEDAVFHLQEKFGKKAIGRALLMEDQTKEEEKAFLPFHGPKNF